MKMVRSATIKLFVVLFVLEYATAGVPDDKLRAQIEADKENYRRRLQQLSSFGLAHSGGTRTLRQQPGYQYPATPQPPFFLPANPTVGPAVTRPTPPPVSYLPPVPTAPPTRPTTVPSVPPSTAPPTQPPTTAPSLVVTETIRPVTIPAFVEPATSAPTTAAPAIPVVTQAPVVFPVRPTVAPVFEPPVMNMALMPQVPAAQMAQITSIDVDCAKESMVVRIKFDRVFGGLIYSKGFHSNLDCHYVKYGTNKDSFQFTIRLDSCGSQWVDKLSSGGQAYLENVIIIQNEPGIQEIWDTSRSIRCFWEGNLEKTVTYAFNIDMLDTQIVSFSGDTATASMDIQLGKGPFAPSVNGLVKIGDTLTMVISIEGDPGFDVQVQQCIAHDGNRANAVTLTDERGCVLKKKLMGPWQKSTQTGRPGVSLVAFSFFQAFKFPDQMEVFLECNVELCKNGCDICPEDAALFDVRTRPKRMARHHYHNHNGTDVSDVRLRRSLRVISNEDIAFRPDSRSVVTLTTGE